MCSAVYKGFSKKKEKIITMQVKEIKNDGLSYEMEVTVSQSEIDQHVDTKLAEYGKTLKIPGFRPGKVPLQVLKQRYGRMVQGEVLEEAVNDSSRKALNEKGLRAALQPKIEVKEFEEGKDLTYTMNVEVLPEFELMDFKGLDLTKQTTKPTDKEIDEAIGKIAENNKDSVEVKADRATKKGDIITIDFKGRTAKDDQEHPGMASEDFDLELGGGQFIGGFEDQLVGKKVGDKVEVKVTFPETYHAAELAGQDAIFDVDVKMIKELKDSKVDDDFAKKLGLTDLDALKKAIEEQLQKEYDKVSRLKLKRDLLDIFDDSHEFPVPQGMLDIEFDTIKQQISMEQPDKVKDGALQFDDGEEEELKAIADRRVRLGMILSEIGRQNNIQVTDAELQRAVIEEAQRYPGQEAQVFEYYRSNPQAQEAIRGPVFEDKVVDFVLELAKLKEKEVSPEEFSKEEEENYTERKGKKKSSSAKSGEKKSSGSKSGGAAKKSTTAKKSSGSSSSKAKKSDDKKK